MGNAQSCQTSSDQSTDYHRRIVIRDFIKRNQQVGENRSHGTLRDHPPIASLTIRLQIVVLLVGKRHLSGVRHFLLVLLEKLGVDLHLRGSESGSRNEFLERGVSQKKHRPNQFGWSVLTSWGLPTSLRASQRKGFSKL